MGTDIKFQQNSSARKIKSPSKFTNLYSGILQYLYIDTLPLKLPRTLHSKLGILRNLFRWLRTCTDPSSSTLYLLCSVSVHSNTYMHSYIYIYIYATVLLSGLTGKFVGAKFVVISLADEDDLLSNV